LREQMVLGKFNTVNANSTVDETLGLRLLIQAGAIIAARRKHLGEGLARTAAWVARTAALVEWVKPDADALGDRGRLSCAHLHAGTRTAIRRPPHAR
jgi:hypothetical protein